MQNSPCPDQFRFIALETDEFLLDMAQVYATVVTAFCFHVKLTGCITIYHWEAGD